MVLTKEDPMTPRRLMMTLLAIFLAPLSAAIIAQTTIGKEVSVPSHLADGDEFTVPVADLIAHGQKLFTAVWTGQEGGGRPKTKGTGAPLSDPGQRLVFPRNFNRVSAPDANSCAGCHNTPFGMAGGGGDIVANVFVLGQRFDFATFDITDLIVTRGAMAENLTDSSLQAIGNSRNTLGMFGSGFIEMLARQITADLQAIRNGIAPGRSAPLLSKGISFGTLARNPDGSWITSGVQGIPSKSLVPDGSASPPSLVIRPFHQAGAVVSLREFTNNAFNHHHGIQPTERFGLGTDPDEDGFTNEMTRADVTAATLFQATLPVPGRVIPSDPAIEAAVWLGEQRFSSIGCATCHIPSLPLTNRGWIFTEPNSFNPSGNLQVGQTQTLSVDLTDKKLPGPRLRAVNGVVHVPAFTDFMLHDITSGPADPNREPLDMQKAATDPAFFAGNSKFLTRKLWGTANEPPFFHHGQFTTLRDATLAHAGEAAVAKSNYDALPPDEQDAVIEFLKSLQVLVPRSLHLIVDEHGNPRPWPPRP
jgi:hypothetical protein